MLLARVPQSTGDQIRKRFTLQGGILNTGAGVVIAVTSINASQVQSAPAAEWASFAARYQQYRVRSLRVFAKATNPVELAALTHSVIFVSDHIGSAAPTTSAQVLSDESVKIIATHRDFEYVVTWSRNPNAKLWNPTSAALPGANDFSISFATPATPPLTTATTYYSVTYEWDVEFRGSQ